MPKTIESID